MTTKKMLVEVQLMEVVVPIVSAEPGDFLQVLNGVCVGKAPRSMVADAKEQAVPQLAGPKSETIKRRKGRAGMQAAYQEVLDFCRTPKNLNEVSVKLGGDKRRAARYT